MRAYTVAAAASALKVTPKWIDNLLSRHTIPGASRQRQGISRRLSPHSILILDLALRINDSFGSPMSRAIEIAQDLTRSADRSRYHVSTHILLEASIHEIEAELTTLLSQAVELAPSPRRARLPARKR